MSSMVSMLVGTRLNSGYWSCARRDRSIPTMNTKCCHDFIPEGKCQYLPIIGYENAVFLPKYLRWSGTACAQSIMRKGLICDLYILKGCRWATWRWFISSIIILKNIKGCSQSKNTILQLQYFSQQIITPVVCVHAHASPTTSHNHYLITQWILQPKLTPVKVYFYFWIDI